ncbi:hypothetical protein FHETE_1587 [Fusarium heterosporum]|uniref:Uncharacterized protein n=1 Tax=Fusarium heterosporum TaxID=42747 RepID=A0A8H5WZ87_FUSHE|nr:hypothetical protein FHETE_1587 [Fusarium heterosporum]
MSTSLRHRLSGGRPHSPDAPLQITIGVCTPSTEDRPSHWVLMLAERDAEYATWYHSIRGPSVGKPWQVLIEQGRLNSWAVDTRYKVTEIPFGRRRAVRAAARRTPGRFCQGWVHDVIEDLEKQEVVPEGTQSIIAELMEEDPYLQVMPQREEQAQDRSNGKRQNGSKRPSSPKSSLSKKNLWRVCFCV